MSYKSKDGKDKFYRTLRLNSEDRKLIKWYRKIAQVMKNELKKEK